MCKACFIIAASALLVAQPVTAQPVGYGVTAVDGTDVDVTNPELQSVSNGWLSDHIDDEDVVFGSGTRTVVTYGTLVVVSEHRRPLHRGSYLNAGSTQTTSPSPVASVHSPVEVPKYRHRLVTRRSVSRRPPPTPSLADGETQVVRLLNQERERHGLLPLHVDAIATEVARAHSHDMCERRYFDHRSPEGDQAWDRLRVAGARFRAAGENIAVGHTSAREVHQDWLNSPGHRKNRLNPTYSRIGVGLHLCGRVPYWTEVFMR